MANMPKVNMAEEAAKVLRNALQEMEALGRNGGSSSSPSPAVGPTAGSGSGRSWTERAEANFRNSFPSISGGGRRFPLNQANGRPPSKKQRKDNVVFVAPKETWTHEFVLLSKKDQWTSPSISEMLSLKEAGLGKVKITFPNKRGGHEALRKVLEEKFSKLASQDGAFELMRAGGGGSSRPLALIPPSAEGYSIPHLKDVVSQSTVIYIRPVQSNLSLEKIPTSNQISPMVSCQTCLQKVPLTLIRSHRESCHVIKTAEVEVVMVEEVDAVQEPQPGPSMVHANQDWEEDLSTMFPDVKKQEISTAIALSATKEEAANSLLDKSTVMKIEKPGYAEDVTLPKLLDDFKDQHTSAAEKEITVDRDAIWMEVVKFYKRAMCDEKSLTRELVVKFCNEDGIDGGAIKREFFNLAFKEIRKRLFEGPEESMLPVKDSSKGLLFRIAGMAVVHSLIQGGPTGLPILAPSVYSYLLSLDEDIIISQLDKSSIPLNSATERLLDLLSHLDDCESDKDLGDLLEGNAFSEAYWAIINSSHWPKESKVSKSTKDMLCQHLIHNEVVETRRMEIDEFRTGLQLFGFLDLVKRHPEITKPLFVTTPGSIFEGKDFLELINMKDLPPEDFAKKQSFEWFLNFVEENEQNEAYPGGSVVSSLLSFCTGSKRPPVGGFDSKIMVKFLAEDDELSLPTSSACLFIINLPTVHCSKKKFFDSMKIALVHESEGFANM